MAFNWAGIVGGVLAVAPAAAILFLGFGRYDGQFRDNVVFLNLIGGMAIGLFASIFLLFLGDVTLGFLAAFALLVPLVVGAAVNRRKWQGDRHVVFNAGAEGAGAGAMMTLVLLREGVVLEVVPLARIAVAAVALTLLWASAGLAIGVAVYDRKPFQGIGLAAAMALPVGFLLYEFLRGGAWLWILLAVAGTSVLWWHADRRWLPVGVTEEGRKRLRRMLRRKMRGEA